uniref:Uncharacterized protein n=1 Tax=viral metagenome TaxID=1070528 RepID=A0A6C0IBT4_9ZZZZ
MDNYFMHYSPNDFFWVSVSGDYDLTQCDSMVNPKHIIQSMATASSTSSGTTSDCPCATTPPPIITAPPMNSTTTILQMAGSSSTKDEIYKEVCKNYVYSNNLIELQTEASAGNELSYDIRGKYNTQIHQLVNLCVGITAMGVLAMVSAKAT